MLVKCLVSKLYSEVYGLPSPSMTKVFTLCSIVLVNALASCICLNAPSSVRKPPMPDFRYESKSCWYSESKH